MFCYLKYTFFHQITSKYLSAAFIASTFSFGGCFLGCFNSSTAFGASYIVNPKDLFTSAIYAVCTLNPYFFSTYSYIILYVIFGFGWYFFALSAIASKGIFPLPSPNSTFTSIWLSGDLWDKSTTVSTCGGTEVLYYMAKIFSLHSGGVNFFDNSTPLTPFEGKSPLYE